MNKKRLAVLLIIAVVSTNVVAQPSDDDPMVNQYRVLVKIQAEEMSAVLTDLPQIKGAVLDTCCTGIRAIDNVIRRYGVPQILRPYSFYQLQSDNDFVGQDRWFEFRFDYAVDVENLRSKLLGCFEVDAVDLISMNLVPRAPRE